MRFHNPVVKQLDRQFEDWRKVAKYQRPQYGWVRTLRKALGMTTQQLAKRLGVHRSRVIKIEEAEKADAVTLQTLRETAKALNCELVYVLIPKDSLENILQTQAKKIANERMQRVSHSQRLENQQTNAKYQAELIENLTESLLTGSLKHLWD